MTHTQPIIQEGQPMEPGRVLSAMQPILLADEPAEFGLVSRLYHFAQFIDNLGGKADIQADLANYTEEILLENMGWYTAALRLERVKFYRVWEGLFAGFKEYCEVAVGRTVATVNNWIRAARPVSILIAQGYKELPNYAVALELSKLNWEIICDLWRDMCDRYPAHQRSLENLKQMSNDPLDKKPKFTNLRTEKYYADRLKEEAVAGGLSASKLLTQILKQHFGSSEQEEEATTTPINYFPTDEEEETEMSDLEFDEMIEKAEELEKERVEAKTFCHTGDEEMTPQEEPQTIADYVWMNEKEFLDPVLWDDDRCIDPDSHDYDPAFDIDPDQLTPDEEEPLLFEARTAKTLGRIKDYFWSNYLKAWAIVERSGHVLPLIEWLEAF